MHFKKITFQNSSGNNLSGRIDFPLVGKPKAFVLFAHCFTCSKNLKSIDHISQAFNQQGMAVFRFDFTGLGQSSGDFSDTNFSSNLSDLKEAYHYLEKNFEAPQIILGHSLGGAAVLHVSSQLPAVQAVATVGAPSTPTHVSHLLGDGREELTKKGEVEVNIGGRPFKMKKQFLDDLEANEHKEVVHHLGKALLVLHSPQDKIVGIESAQEIYLEARHPKSFVSLDGADHLLTDAKDARYVGSMVAGWAARYIEENKQEEAPEGEIWTRVGEKGYTTEVTAGQHQLVADEPPSVGGDDLGPTPYGYLLSGLGACTAMTLRMYADFKKIPLKGVKVKLIHDKIHKIDGENSEVSVGKIDQIKRMISLKGDLTDEQRKRLISIADRCPVHKTLEEKLEILTEEIS